MRRRCIVVRIRRAAAGGQHDGFLLLDLIAASSPPISGVNRGSPPIAATSQCCDVASPGYLPLVPLWSRNLSLEITAPCVTWCNRFQRNMMAALSFTEKYECYNPRDVVIGSQLVKEMNPIIWHTMEYNLHMPYSKYFSIIYKVITKITITAVHNSIFRSQTTLLSAMKTPFDAMDKGSNILIYLAGRNRPWQQLTFTYRKW